MAPNWRGQVAALVITGVLLVAGCQRSRPRVPPPAGDQAAGPQASMEKIAGLLREAGAGGEIGAPASVKTYRPAEMYEAIDGEADLFIAYDCGGLAVARYEMGQAIVDAEVFDQGEPLNAFGVFSQLREEGAASPAIGAGSVWVAEEAIFFWKSRYFVRVSSASAQRLAREVLVGLARCIADRLAGSSTLPGWTAALPTPESKGEASQYVARNVLGHAFLSHAMIADHPAGQGSCRLVLARADGEAEAQTWWRQLTAFYRGAAGDAAVEGLGSEAFAGRDLQGEPVRGVREGQYLVLVVGTCEAAAARRLVSTTLERLEGQT